MIAVSLSLQNQGNLAWEEVQATESFYHGIMLVFSGYKRKLHDIEELRSLASNYNEELWSIFAHSSEEQKKSFELLQKAYIEARYSDDYKISREQLLYLIGEVEKLQKVNAAYLP
jgi:hypothetical protein